MDYWERDLCQWRDEDVDCVAMSCRWFFSFSVQFALCFSIFSFSLFHVYTSTLVYLTFAPILETMVYERKGLLDPPFGHRVCT